MYVLLSRMHFRQKVNTKAVQPLSLLRNPPSFLHLLIWVSQRRQLPSSKDFIKKEDRRKDPPGDHSQVDFGHWRVSISPLTVSIGSDKYSDINSIYMQNPFFVKDKNSLSYPSSLEFDSV